LKQEVEKREKEMGERIEVTKDQVYDAIVFNPIVRCLYEKCHEELRQRELFIAEYTKVLDNIDTQIKEIEAKRDAWVSYLDENDSDSQEEEGGEDKIGYDDKDYNISILNEKSMKLIRTAHSRDPNDIYFSMNDIITYLEKTEIVETTYDFEVLNRMRRDYVRSTKEDK
jgi:hypothetical protein